MSLGVLEECEYQVHPERTAVGPMCLVVAVAVAVAVAASAEQEQGRSGWKQEQESVSNSAVAPFGRDC
jgi:hypothetical protein